MLVNSLILAISSSIDSLGIGITYGIRNTKISNLAKIILFFISFIISIFSIWFGNILKDIFPEIITKIMGNLMLIFMGIFICFEALKKESKQSKNINLSDEFDKQKIYSFFIKYFGITIKIIKNPISSDFDNSKSIDSKEALFLGLALSLDSFCIGIGSSIMGINSSFFPLLVSFFQLLFLSFGNYIGRKLNKTSKLPDNIWSIISGLLLIFIGFFKFFV